MTDPSSKQHLSRWLKKFSKSHPEIDVPPVPKKAPGIFGVPLHESVLYANVAINLADEAGNSFIYGYIPIVVAKCGAYLKENATETEGIFRLGGSIAQINELQAKFNSADDYGKSLDWSGYSVHVCGGVLRRYLKELPEPVIPFSFYHQFREPLKGLWTKDSSVEPFNIDHAITTYKELVTELPAFNRQLLLYILDLLAVFASKPDKTLMPASNLAQTFTPGLLALREHDILPLEHRRSQEVITFLIENQDHFVVGMPGTAVDEQTKHDITQHSNPASATGSPRPVSFSRSISVGSAQSAHRQSDPRRNLSQGSAPTNTAGISRSSTVPSRRPSASPALNVTSSRRRPAAVASEDAPPLSPHLRPVPDKRPSSVDRELRTDPAASLASSKDESSNAGPSRPPPTHADASSASRRPNKLQKKRPDSSILGAKDSMASLSGASYPPSPAPAPINVTDTQRLDSSASMLEQVNEHFELAPEPSSESGLLGRLKGRLGTGKD